MILPISMNQRDSPLKLFDEYLVDQRCACYTVPQASGQIVGATNWESIDERLADIHCSCHMCHRNHIILCGMSVALIFSLMHNLYTIISQSRRSAYIPILKFVIWRCLANFQSRPIYHTQSGCRSAENISWVSVAKVECF